MSLALMVLFVVVFVYSVVTSVWRVKTILYTVGAVIVTLLLCVLLNIVKPMNVDKLGEITMIATSLVGIAVAFIHSRRSRALPA